MKLLNKINIRYLLFSISVLILLGIVIYFVLSYIISEELDEKLLNIQKTATAQIKNENQIPVIKPYIEVVEVAYKQEQSYFSDTIIEILHEKEWEEFRQLILIKTINGKTYKIIVRESKLESLINGNGLNTKQLGKVKSIYSSVHRLSRFNKSLLLLTKIENKQFRDDEEISVRKVIEEKLIEFQELIGLKKLQLETNLNEDISKVMSPSLADLLVNNLISNSINHNKEKGKIKIEIKERQLSISNSGDTQLSNSGNIFNRFYKENASSKSVGLGLAIVKKICDTHNIKITYSFKETMHCFMLDL